MPSSPPSPNASTVSMLQLQQGRLRPVTGKLYIASMVAGPNLMPKNPYGGGYKHALVMKFARTEDWLYYKDMDHVH